MIPFLKSTRINKTNRWWYTWLPGRETDWRGDKHLGGVGGGSILHPRRCRQNSRNLYILLYVSYHDFKTNESGNVYQNRCRIDIHTTSENAYLPCGKLLARSSGHPLKQSQLLEHHTVQRSQRGPYGTCKPHPPKRKELQCLRLVVF